MKRTLTSLALMVLALGIVAGIVFWQSTSAAEFSSAKDAVGQLIAAMRSDDRGALRRIFGPDSGIVINSGDPVADRYARQRFVKAYDTHEQLKQIDPAHAVLLVGEDNFRFPIPLVRSANGSWFFDTAAGRDEVRARRVGRNELYAIQVCKSYVDAQREFASVDRGDGVLDYAQHLISTKGFKDGLYWPAKAGEPQSPFGPLAAEAEARGYATDGQATPRPFNGYFFRILNAQGWAAKGGAYSYLAYGKMIGGFGLIAYPAKYRVSGIMTFIVNQDGVIYQRDLGPNTPAIATDMTAFDPSAGWAKP